MRDCILGTSLHTIATENAAAVIDVVNVSVALVHPDTLSGRARIVFGDDVDAFRRTGSGAKKARDALLFSILIDMEQVLAAITRLNRHWLFGVLHSLFRFWNVGQRNAHALDDGACRIDHFGND